jgi:predicted ATP-binding protein involved in virulence
MKIAEISFKHYRGVESLHLQLNKNLNVFVGVNGSGKSTVLDGIAIMLSWAVSRIKSVGASGRPIPEADIKNGRSSASIEISCDEGDQEIFWKVSKSRKGHGSSADRSDLNNLSEFTRQLHSRISATDEMVDLPLLQYYAVNRVVQDIPLRIRGKHTFGLLTAYDDATSGTNFRTFFEWFREREDLENEDIKYSNNLSDSHDSGKLQFSDRQLEAVRDALQRFLPEFTNFRVRRSPLRMEVQKNGQSLTVNQLSDGEKCLIAMIGDLARRMAIANPTRDNPLEGNGIILIDEIDLHLHPKWQRNFVPKLVEVFPNCQFILSTHSPHVINHVQPENLFFLDQSSDGIVATRPSKSYGNNADRILEDLMGLETTRPDDVFQELREIYELISQNLLTNATNKIALLKNKIGTDPELVKAEVLIKRKELIGK